MRYTADHAFHIGTQHIRGGMPCQDYALSGQSPDAAFGVISDGCSTGRHTDVGARIIAFNTASALQWTRLHFFPWPAIDEYCKYNDEIARAALGLEQRDMLATCGYVAITGKHVVVRLIGDGVIAAKRLNGEIVMTRIDWAGNRPLYRTYAADGYAGFIAAHGGHSSDAALVTRFIRHADGTETSKVMRQQMHEMLPGFGDYLDLSDFEFFAVFSDGVDQVVGVEWMDVVAKLMDYKTTEGAFVKRRMNRFMAHCEKADIPVLDDISMACIHIERDEPEEKREPCTAEARAEGCTCRMESVNSASIDPPEPIIDGWCPVHGGRDPDAELERQRDDGEI